MALRRRIQTRANTKEEEELQVRACTTKYSTRSCIVCILKKKFASLLSQRRNTRFRVMRISAQSSVVKHGFEKYIRKTQKYSSKYYSNAPYYIMYSLENVFQQYSNILPQVFKTLKVNPELQSFACDVKRYTTRLAVL